MIDFYPRSPRGERPAAESCGPPSPYFYPRSPRGERRGYTVPCCRRPEFLSTLPARGATIHPWGVSSANAHFYPRSPRGERPFFSARMASRARIFLSTLPARGATRPAVFRGMAGLADFYPRSPRGERPAARHGTRCALYFYPRSPRGERPAVPITIRYAIVNFYPRSPRGERRLSRPHPRHRPFDFYPRSPRGERPCFSVTASASHPFLSTLPARGATSGCVGS